MPTLARENNGVVTSCRSEFDDRVPWRVSHRAGLLGVLHHEQSEPGLASKMWGLIIDSFIDSLDVGGFVPGCAYVQWLRAWLQVLMLVNSLINDGTDLARLCGILAIGFGLAVSLPMKWFCFVANYLLSLKICTNRPRPALATQQQKAVSHH